MAWFLQLERKGLLVHLVLVSEVCCESRCLLTAVLLSEGPIGMQGVIGLTGGGTFAELRIPLAKLTQDSSQTDRQDLVPFFHLPATNTSELITY